jgi:hypothetical protein
MHINRAVAVEDTDRSVDLRAIGVHDNHATAALDCFRITSGVLFGYTVPTECACYSARRSANSSAHQPSCKRTCSNDRTDAGDRKRYHSGEKARQTANGCAGS